MSGTMQCPSCKEQIDDDSIYCDQCGEQIFVCSVCGRPGKGKRCIFDGKEMVPSEGARQQSVQINQTAHINTSSPAPANPPVSQPVQQAPSVDDKLILSSQSHGIMIEVADGGIIGRKNGPFAGIFGSFSHISGTHCKFTKTGEMWYVQDMGSTNGTFYNNSRLAPNIPALLQSGTNIKLADMELSITFNTNSGTVRV